ncbi:hypothetical protein L2E82_13583 [Cichorium intybus]|uniref:Uncharacterized protein n=1 Tax=Cichorium intybus TaxID=13427 RepID=A0ACB9EYA2_CICIN|nr:hypothetical protein L2E82_13583 [Cichorium intybus]
MVSSTSILEFLVQFYAFTVTESCLACNFHRFEVYLRILGLNLGEGFEDTQRVKGNVLALIHNVLMLLHEILNTMRMVRKEAVQKIGPLSITHGSSVSSLQMDTSSLDFIISMGTSQFFPGDKLFEEFSRVLKPGGEIFIHQTLDSAKENTTSSLERKLLVAGFSDIEVVQMVEVLSEGLQSFGVKGKKPSWKIGSSFSLKKKLPKVQIMDEMDLIDEDIGDCEVGSTRKACKNYFKFGIPEPTELPPAAGVSPLPALQAAQPPPTTQPVGGPSLLKVNKINDISLLFLPNIS